MGLQWPSKRVEALGKRKFRDIVGVLPQSGHLRDKAKNPGLSRPFRDGWQLYMTVHDKNSAAAIFCACALRARACEARALDAPRDYTK